MSENSVFEALASFGEIPNLVQIVGTKSYKKDILSTTEDGLSVKKDHYTIQSYLGSNALYVEDYVAGQYKIFKLMGADSARYEDYNKFFYVHNGIALEHN